MEYKTISLRVRDETYRELKLFSLYQNVSMTDYISALIDADKKNRKDKMKSAVRP